jgi:hypothetical protein
MKLSCGCVSLCLCPVLQRPATFAYLDTSRERSAVEAKKVITQVEAFASAWPNASGGRKVSRDIVCRAALYDELRPLLDKSLLQGLNPIWTSHERSPSLYTLTLTFPCTNPSSAEIVGTPLSFKDIMLSLEDIEIICNFL